MKQALALSQLLESPEIHSKADLARHLGISRARVTQTLNLLKPAPDIQVHILSLPDGEAAFFNERRLSPLSKITPRGPVLRGRSDPAGRWSCFPLSVFGTSNKDKQDG